MAVDARKPQTIIVVDLLRFTCAMLVVAHHFDVAFWSAPSWRSAIMLAPAGPGFGGTALTRVGWIGVELFFVISGMVIAQSAAGIGAATFLRRRALRLVPAAWICASITAAALILSGLGRTVAVPWLRSAILWPVGEQIDGSYWTLGIECSFYLIVALAIRSNRSGRQVERVGIAIGLLSTAFWTTWLLVGHVIGSLPGDRYVMLALLPHGCLFAIGVLIASFHDRPTPQRSAWLGLFILTATVEIGQHVLERHQLGITGSPLLAETIFLGGLLLLISAKQLQPWIGRWIDPGTARMIGLMTYPLYLLHQDAGAALLGALATAGVPLRPAIGMCVAVMVGLSWLVAIHLEPRLRRLLGVVLAARGRATGASRIANSAALIHHGR